MASNKPVAITAKKVEENIDTLCPQVRIFVLYQLNLIPEFLPLPGTHLYSRVGRDMLREKCLVQEHKAMNLAKA